MFVFAVVVGDIALRPASKNDGSALVAPCKSASGTVSIELVADGGN